jgi:phosphoglycerate dehydrogenase-like enzyme
LNPETKGLIDLDELKKMKTKAFIINTARGAIINETSLYTALVEDNVAGAGLDVTNPDPLPINSPLLKIDRVILTGHSAYASKNAWTELGNRQFEEAARVQHGEWPRVLVNPEVKQKDNCRGPVHSNQRIETV